MQNANPSSQGQTPKRVPERPAPSLRTTAPTKFQLLEAKIDGGRSARIPFLNADIISSILEHIETDRHFEDFATSPGVHSRPYLWQPSQVQLLDLCTVSYQWPEPCRKFLYRGYHARSSENIIKFASALRGYPTLGLYVRYLLVGNWGIARFVSLMPNIELLWLLAEGWPVFLDSSILSLERLRHVTFANGEFNIAWADEKIARTAWPRLETLVSRTGPTLFPLCLALKRMPFASFRTLAWMPIGLSYGNHEQGSIPSLCPNTLREVGFVNLRLPKEILFLPFHSHSNSLEDLAIPKCQVFSHETPIVSALKSVTNVQIFEFFDNSFSISNLRELPGTIIELTIDWSRCTPEAALEFIRERSANAGSLRSLGIGTPWGTRDAHVEEWESRRCGL
jgi:hypothetical protein